MAENENNEQPEETPAADTVDPAPASEPPPAPVLVPRWRDRAFTFRSVLAVGVATLLLGGAGGAALVAATDDDHGDRPRIARFGDGPGRHGDDQRYGGGQWGDGPGGPGFAPPNMQNGPRNAPDSGSQQDGSQPESGSNS